jgi:hypothetical protein
MPPARLPGHTLSSTRIPHPFCPQVLNRNPDNFFLENEQLAFCPALVVPGEMLP